MMKEVLLFVACAGQIVLDAAFVVLYGETYRVRNSCIMCLGLIFYLSALVNAAFIAAFAGMYIMNALSNICNVSAESCYIYDTCYVHHGYCVVDNRSLVRDLWLILYISLICDLAMVLCSCIVPPRETEKVYYAAEAVVCREDAPKLNKANAIC